MRSAENPTEEFGQGVIGAELHKVHSEVAYFALHKADLYPYVEPNEIEPLKRQGNSKETTMNMARSFNNWRKFRQTCNELNRMSDRELNDIGVHRSDIARIARQAI